jgi:hypothetical protein
VQVSRESRNLQTSAGFGDLIFYQNGRKMASDPGEIE